MKTSTLVFKRALLLFCSLFTIGALSQDFNVQHVQDDVANSGGTNTSFTAVSSLNNAVAIANNNRKVSAGPNGNTGNMEGDDLAGARVLTATGTLTYYRESGSIASNTRFNTSIWEYIGPAAGNNEFIVRGRYAVSLNGGTNSTTQALTGITNAADCIPFITGIMNNSTSDDADSGTAIAYLENATTLRVLKGSNGNNVTVYVTVVEFTGSNWTVLHGDSGSVSADTGTLTLRNNSDGTGTATNVSAWSDAVIFSHHIGDTGASGTNDAIADNWPVMDPGANNQTVDWTFDGNHDSAGTNRQFVHVLTNTGLNVTRYQNTSNSAGQTTIDITSAGLTSVNEALIVGSSRSSGTGTAYGRGWRNYYFNSTTQAAHWSHRNNNTMAHEIQIVDLSGLTTSGPEMNILGNAVSIADGDTTPNVADDTDFGNVDITLGTNANTFTIQNLGATNLNLTSASPYVVISGTHAADFTVTGLPPTTPIGPAGSTTFTITFNPSGLGLRTASVSIANDDSDENPYNFDIQGNGTTTVQEINVTGLGNNILTGDITPTTTDGTDFGSVLTPSGTSVSSFTIENLGTGSVLSLLGPSPYVTIAGPHAADFAVTAIPNNSIGASSNTFFNITFNPSADGLRQATVTILNNDPNEGTYTFSIQGTGYTPPPCGQTVEHTADFESGWDGWTDGGTNAQRVNNAGRSYSNSYSLEIRSNDTSGNNSSVLSPLFDFSAYDKVDFKFFFTAYNVENTETFIVEYSPDSGTNWNTVVTYTCGDVASKTGDYESTNAIIFYSNTATLFDSVLSFPAGTTSQIRVRSNASDTSDLVYLDYVTITGTEYCTPVTGPGGVTADLDLWLRADMVDGTGTGTDGTGVSQWFDTGKGNHAEATISAQEPTYRHNTTNNFNFNPVIEFANVTNTSSGDMTHLLTDREVLSGTGGFNSNDIFLVVIPDPTITTSMIPMDTFTGDDPLTNSYTEDVTGVGYGGYTARLTGEYFAYCIGGTNNSAPYPGYGSGATSSTVDYSKLSIMNIRHDSSNTGEEIFLNATQIDDTENDPGDFSTITNTRYNIGRSQYWSGSFDGKIAEIITYDSRKTDGSTERRRIESYLALKYGITLGVNGTSMDYVDSNGSTVWDATANAGYNYDIAGIFREDASNHSQKQSKSINSSSVVTIGHVDIASDNASNTNNFTTDRDYLVWGHNNDALSGTNSITVDIGASSTTVTTVFDRRWKIVEHRPTAANDILDVKVSVPTGIFPALSDPANEEYALIVSNSSTFTSGNIVDIIPMNQNGSNFETLYDFDNTRYFTFGIASRVTGKFNVEFAAGDFLVGENTVDLNSSFTISSWVRNLGSGGSVVSKGNAYDLRIDGTGKIQVVLNGITRITSSTSVNDSKWHHISATYSSNDLRLYIDGVEDSNSPQTSIPIPTSTTDRFAIGVNYIDKDDISTAFNGDIDEVRVWDSALSLTQIQFIMNQEISEHTDSNVKGDIIPQTITKNEVGTIPWSNLQAYHNINGFYGTTVEDGSDNNHWVRIKYLVPGKDIIDNQTTPLPYASNGSGDWDTTTTWKTGSESYIPGSASIADPNVTVDWNIVSVSHNVTMDNTSLPATNNDNRTLLGLIADSTKELTVNSDSGLTVTHYLELNGSIDLEGESQLMQTDRSVLEVGANGSLERDQQGTQNLYTYNYWSSPVGVVNTSATNDSYTSSYTVADILYDGTNPASPGSINWITTGVDGTLSPFGIADYWIWKFANGLDDDYSSWQHMRSTGTIEAGEGYTMKGPGTGSISTPQNYVFEGKPNNGDISLSISAGYDYLVGNPYPSAIDAHEFLDDNPDTDGTLYFWEHWGGWSHILWDYQGGYALYNYSGGVPTASYGTNDPDVATGGTPTKLPGQYIPVSQGFFVVSPGGGTITFENDQRIFQKEGASSTFVRTNEAFAQQPTDYNEDTRTKFRIGFDSFNTIHRQLLLTVDENATFGYDWGYDGPQNRLEMDDMFWLIEGEKYGIQGVHEVTPETVLPLGIKVRDDGMNSIRIDHLENVADHVDIYIRDKELDTYNDLRQGQYEFYLTSGMYLDRFELVFYNRRSSLDVNDSELSNLFEIYYQNDNSQLVIKNPNNLDVNNVEMFNLIGQSIFKHNNLGTSEYKEFKLSKLSSGTYIIRLDTNKGSISKKVLVE